jgi:hypothetical protein
MKDDTEARAFAEYAKEELREIKRTHYDQFDLSDFLSFLSTAKYIFKPTGELWPAKSVNAKQAPVGDGKDAIKATVWLDQFTPVVQMIWAPGEDQVIQDRLIVEGGFVDRPGMACFNTYRPPEIVLGDKTKAEPWLKHVIICFPDDYEHIIGFLAHAVQRPYEKVNHALVLISRAQGIGKDTLLAAARQAVGVWNCAEVSPQQLVGRFNGFAKSVILRVSEAKDLGETNRYAFYDHCKVFAASPPEVHRCDEKNKPEQQVLNRCHLVITSNYLTGGLYLPPEDRRHYVAESPRQRKILKMDIGMGFGLGITMAVLKTWRHTCTPMISTGSTPKHHQRRPGHFGILSATPCRRRRRE